MRLTDLAGKAKQLIDRRGGTGSLKEDAEELRAIARSEGTLGDKAKRAAEAVKEPGAGPRSDYDPAAGPTHAEPAPDRVPPERGRGPSETSRRRERRERRAGRRG
jgi:hypothetical protein